MFPDHRCLLVATIAVGAVAYAGSAHADDATTGSAAGHIELDGAPAPGAIIELVAADGAVVGSAISEADGGFRIDSVAPGSLTVRVTLGAMSAQRTVSIAAHATASVDVALAGAPDPSAEGAGEVIAVEGSTADAIQHSAEAVNVVETTHARQQTADLGEVLARTQGVAVRRSAGLGSAARFSLDGLYDDQIRMFFDGVPLAIAGYPFGIANVPVNLIDRVEIYRGVVPVRFGADALGGAVNLVSSNRSGSHAAASYETGSFGTHRATLSLRHEAGDGLVAGATLLLDHTRNDYDVDVQVADAQGQLHAATVPRFHDGYGALGVTVNAGFVDRGWADRLELRGYATGYDKDLQNNATMTVPYGEAGYGERVTGATASYQVHLPAALRLEAVAAYARRTIHYTDQSDWVYDWFGQRVRQRVMPGELESPAHDDVYWQDDGFGRVLVASALPAGELRLAISPAYSRRTGENNARTDRTLRDPLSAHHARFAAVSGLEWELDALDDAIENIAFVKNYAFHASYENVEPGNRFASLSHDIMKFGGGDSLRWRARPWLYLKASYEYATRLPSTDELFGNGVLIASNLELVPEVSHNVNLGPRLEWHGTRAGDAALDVSGFLRHSQDLIVLIGNNQLLTYQNVYTARSLGVEAAATWSPPVVPVTLDATLTYDDLRNASTNGTFGAFDGDRVPNRPWLFASFGARGRIALPRSPGLGLGEGTIEPFYIGRYVHSFLRGWESIGSADSQQVIAAQLSHGLGATWTGAVDRTQLSVTLEVDNLADTRLYDSFGAQRPGRAYYLKLTAAL